MSESFVVGSTGKAVIPKDPNAVLDYTIDWTLWLDAIPDTIQSAVAAIDNAAAAGGTINSSTIVGGKAVVIWVGGGTVGQTMALRCRITTVGLRTDDRTVYLKVKER